MMAGWSRAGRKQARPSVLIGFILWYLSLDVERTMALVTHLQQQLSFRIPAPEIGWAHRQHSETWRNRQRSPLQMATKSGGRPIKSADEFDSLVASPHLPRPVLAFYTAPWCGPCRLSNPVVRDVMKQFNEQVDVVEICSDDLPETCADAGVVSIPTIQIYYGGALLDTIVGCVARNVLASAVNKILEDLSGGDASELPNGES